MKRVWGHVVAAVSVLAGVAAGFSACVHDDSTIFVRSVLAPQTSSQVGTQCVYTNDPAQPFLSSGVLDLALKGEYDAEFLLGNQLVSQANSNQLQTETSLVTISAAIVRITTAGGVELNRYSRLAAASIVPASGNTPGYSEIGPVDIVDGRTIGSDAVQLNLVLGGTVRLVTHVRFSGKTLGGQSVESNEFEFPVDICRGCLVAFANNPSCPMPNCVANVAVGGAASQPLIPCGNSLGQDLRVDCATCANLGNQFCFGAFGSTSVAGCFADAGGGGG
jgi:hypothetical protein